MENRKTLGFLTHEIDGIYPTFSWLSAKKAAEQYDCNLIAFEGRILDYSNSVDSQHNIIYQFVDKNRLDGLIIGTGTLLNRIGYSNMLDFLKQYSDLPVISIGVVFPGTTSILVDNTSGMKSLTSHLIEFHNYKRIAFLKGPENNDEANERFQAYLDVLNEHQIEYDDNIVLNGDFSSDSGYIALKEYLGRHDGKNFDALICANDDMAIAALKAAREFNLDVPGNFALCGFDDNINASIISPSLTTVRQPIREMFCSAVELVLKKIDNESADDVVISPSTLVIRESCGCSCTRSSLYSFSGIDVNIDNNYKVHENIQTYSLDEFFSQITGALKNYKTRSCFISKYSEGTVYFDDSFIFPERSELIYAYYDYDCLNIDDSSRYFRTRNLLPDIYMPKDRRFTFLLKPLFFKNEHFGFVVFEIENDDVIYFELLRGQISNTLKGAFTLIERGKMEEFLRQKDRLASLGQLISGIYQNFNTPILSIASVYTGLEYLVKEYTESLDDPCVTSEDYYEITREMSDWVQRLKGNVSYMSQIISDVKMQAVQLNSSTTEEFTIKELINGIMLLIKSNLKINEHSLNTTINVDLKTIIKGDLSNLVQVLYNIIINAYQSYEGTLPDSYPIDFTISRENTSINFIIKDFGKGIPDHIKSKIFKQMVTSKGRNSTGLSLLLSYSTILGKFGGEIWFETVPEQGTVFYISIPSA